MYSNRFDISELFPKFPNYFRINKSRSVYKKRKKELVQKDIFLFNDIVGAGANYQLKIIAS